MKSLLLVDRVCILIKILVGDHWAFVLGEVKTDSQTYRFDIELSQSVFLFKAIIPG